VLIDPPLSTSVWRDAAAAKAATSSEVLTQLIRTAAADSLLIVLDMHRLVGEIWPDARGLWYSPLVPEEAVHAAWRIVARRYCGEWNVMGADLLNEHAMRRDRTSRLAATRM
jgi:aryl-phospho-beta-D-glucosidase BglC (GH1 family)